jgi:YegS/Rv2252/BmrU family lipid kinase
VTRAFVVVNPAAGGGRTALTWPLVAAELNRLGLAFESACTTRRGHATDLARRAAGAGWPLVVAVGGDGTLNEVVNGVTDAGGTPLATTGAILTGRGRDAHRNFGLAADWRLAARRIVEGDDAVLDLGAAEWPGGASRYFVSAAGAGFDAVVARRAVSRGGIGTLPYLLAVVEGLIAHRPIPTTIETDGGIEPAAPLTAVVVANGAYYGGGMQIAPPANPADGALDLVVLGALDRLELLRWLPTVYRGAHLANPRITIRPIRQAHVAGATPLPTHVDGEPAADTPVTFRVCPRALRLRR